MGHLVARAIIAFKARVSKAETNKLRPLVMSHAETLGTTPTGADWCLKALHPSDPLVEVRGIPDQESGPTVMLNYQSTYRLSPQSGSTGTWRFNASLLPNPVQFMYVDHYDSVTPTGVEHNFHNAQLPGANFDEMSMNFMNQGERWRLAYMSVTCYQDGPDLANQGTIVACQNAVEGWSFPVCWTMDTFETSMAFPVLMYQDSDKPDYTTAQSMPNAYFNRSREGAYVPLKLTGDFTRWRSMRDSTVPSTLTSTGITGVYRVPKAATYPFPHANTTAAGGGTVHPTFTCNPLDLTPGGAFHPGSPIPAMLNGNWAHICAENLDVATSFTFYVRCGIEIQVQPGSMLAPQMKLSPPNDELALATYFRVARELKDAYPADFNDLGTMWDVVSRAAKVALPWVAKAGPYGAAAATLGTGIVRMGDSIRESRKQGRDRPPAAAVERARENRAVTRVKVINARPLPGRRVKQQPKRATKK